MDIFSFSVKMDAPEHSRKAWIHFNPYAPHLQALVKVIWLIELSVHGSRQKKKKEKRNIWKNGNSMFKLWWRQKETISLSFRE